MNAKVTCCRGSGGPTVPEAYCGRERPMDSNSERPKPNDLGFGLLRVKMRKSKRRCLLQLIGDLVDTGFHACLIFFAARSAGGSRRADYLVADFDRQCALVGDDIGEVNKAERRVIFQSRDDFTRRHTESACGICFAKAVLSGVRPCVIAADLHDDLAIAPDDGRRHGIAVGLAGGDRGGGDSNGHFGRNILVLEEISTGRLAECGDTRERSSGGEFEHWHWSLPSVAAVMMRPDAASLASVCMARADLNFLGARNNFAPETAKVLGHRLVQASNCSTNQHDERQR